MRRLTRSGLAATAAAFAAVGMIGLASPSYASAARASAAPSVKVVVAHQLGGTTVTLEVTSGLCAAADSELYVSSYGYETVKAYWVTPTCGYIIQAGITCSGENLWGYEDTNDGEAYASVAACNSSYPKFDHGGYRIYVNGGWQYYTYVYT